MPNDASQRVPVFQAYLLPIVNALRDATGPVANDVLNTTVAANMRLSDEVLDVKHDPEHSDQPEAFYRMAWARTYLKKVGLIDNPRRGVWTLTARGRESIDVDATEVVKRVRAGYDGEPATTEVSEYVAEELLAIHRTLLVRDRLPVGEALDACYRRFRERFGPEALRRLDGPELLTTIHGRQGNKNSLVYWLEFKDDDEMPAVFGSIAGGSALKFGIYQSNETGEWITGRPTAQQTVSIEDAVAFVRKQRDQLVAGGDHLLALAQAPEVVDYSALQHRLTEVAPDLADSAWGHKYFALLAPSVLDDYHAEFYQRFHLIKLLMTPGEGRYENARLFVAIARQLGVPIAHLSAVLNERDGSPHAYWRIDLSRIDSGSTEWQRMRDGAFVGVGWSDVGTLVDIEHTKAGKEQLRRWVAERGHESSVDTNHAAQQLFNFATVAAPRDLVVATQGSTVIGVGKIHGAYYFESTDGPCAHRRPVTWMSLDEWQLSGADIKETVFGKLKGLADWVAIERHLVQPSLQPSPSTQTRPRPTARPQHQPLTGVPARVEDALRRKGQVILYGPPGTGKTYWAQRAVHELVARAWFDSTSEELSDSRRAELSASGAVEQCCFHPAYGYEDFLAGYRPTVQSGVLTYTVKKGVFARVCERALGRPDRPFYLLVDEINRGDIARIFGELLSVMERDKRGTAINVPLLAEPFIVPANVYLIGTMNTADRSIALLDAALRRRFAFIELMPDVSTLEKASVASLPLGPWLAELNRRVLQFAGRDARNLQIGQAYLLHGGEPIRTLDRFIEVLRDDIIPLLQEYCYEDFGALERILGGRIVLKERQQINHALFEPGRGEDLIDALLTAFEAIVASRSAARAAGAAGEIDAGDTDDGDDDDTTVDRPPS